MIKNILYRLIWSKNMTKAPKDIPILVKINSLSELDCPDCTNTGLCIYHGHAYDCGQIDADYCVAVWGGGWDDRTYFESNGGSMPDWWFLYDGVFETAVNPVAWKLI